MRIILVPGMLLFLVEALVQLPLHMLAGVTFNYMFSNMVIYLFGFAMSATELERVQMGTLFNGSVFHDCRFSCILAST